MTASAPEPAPNTAAQTLQLTLQRSHPQGGWTAELRTAHAAPLRFATLPALIAYIVRLDPSCTQGGLR